MMPPREMPTPETPNPREEMLALLQGLKEQMDRIERQLATNVTKETYTTEEAAERLHRGEWTVRHWCNKGQVQGARKVHGRGKTGEWRIPHDEVVRLQNEGPLPPGSFNPHGPARRKAA